MSFVLIFRFMAGFQYIALEGSVDIDGDEKVDSIELAVFSLRYCGFLSSLGGTLICIIVAEYLKTIQQESIETQVKGILRYAYFFQMADYTAIFATFALGGTVNILLWRSSIPTYLAITFNALCVFCTALLLQAFNVIIFKRQKSRFLYDDEDYLAARTRNQRKSLCEKLGGMFDSFLWN